MPNPLWGYGKVDAFATVAGCAAGVNEMNALSGNMTISPNPAEQTANVYYVVSAKKPSQKYFIRLSDVLGKNLEQIPLENASGYVPVPVESLSQGIYFCSLYAGDVLVESKKLVVK